MVPVATSLGTLLGLLCLLGAPTSILASDWPNFRGPNHDGISTETGFSTKWPKTGPRELWQRVVGAGFSSFAIVGDRLYTCGTVDQRQSLFCLNASTGEIIWKQDLEPQITDPDKNLYGPRATPTVNAGRVYMMAAHGRVFCFDAKSGKELWQREFSHKPGWGYSGSVLIEGDLAIVAGGGSDGSLCAMDKKTGAPVWKCGDDPAGYATPYPFTLAGKRYVCGFMAQSCIVAELQTGRQVLRVDWPSHSGVNASSPIFQDGHLFISTGYGFGSGVFKLEPDGDRLAAKEVWRSARIKNKFQTPILTGGNLYTSDESGLKCVDFKTGKRHWRKGGIKHGTLLLADGHLLLLTEKGELQVAKASTDGFEVLAKAKLFEGTTYSLLQRVTRQRQGPRCWTVPVLCGGRLYARNHNTVICLDLRPNEAGVKGSP